MNQSKSQTSLMWLLLLIGVYIVGMAIFVDHMFIMQSLLIWGSNLAIITLIVGPFVWLMGRKKRSEHVQLTGRLVRLAALLFLVEIFLLFSGPHLNVFPLEWNWIGKILSLSIAILFISLWPGLSWREIGVTTPRRGSWLRVGLMLAGAFGFWALAASSAEQPINLDVESLLYQATMPGLEEELVFRGILWVLIAQAIPGSRRLWGAKVGWDIIITTLLFATIHGITFDNQLSFVFDPAILVFAGASGLIFGWIRAYSGSIIPAIVLHNGINLLAVIVPWLLV